jgi:hypothetical protein
VKAAALALALLGLIVSARTRLSAVVLGQPVSMPVLWLIAAIMVLALFVAVLVLVRLLVRDLRPVTT